MNKRCRKFGKFTHSDISREHIIINNFLEKLINDKTYNQQYDGLLM